MKKRLLPLIPWLEMALAYAVLFAWVAPRVDGPLLLVAFLAAGLLFALFYAFRGALVGAAAFAAAILARHHFQVANFATEDYLAVAVGAGALFVAGGVRRSLDDTVTLLQRRGDLLEERSAGILSELISYDVSQRVFLEDMYFRLDDPIFIYHELRKQCLGLEEKSEFFAQLFKVLNRYLFVERGAVYRREGDDHVSVFRYGRTALPERVARGDRPHHFTLMLKTRRVIFSRFPDRHGFLIAMPVPGVLDDEIAYVVVIERIRFVMLNPRSHANLKAVSLMVKQVYEKKFAHDELMAISVTRRAHVFDEPTTRRLLAPRLRFLEQAGVAHLVIAHDPIEGTEALEETAAKMELALRILDDKYMLDGRLHAVLLFTSRVEPVLQRLAGGGLDAARIKEVDRAVLLARLTHARQ